MSKYEGETKKRGGGNVENYLIYAGGERGGQLYVQLETEPNADGLVIVRTDEYENALVDPEPEDCPTELYDVVSNGEITILYPVQGGGIRDEYPFTPLRDQIDLVISRGIPACWSD